MTKKEERAYFKAKSIFNKKFGDRDYSHAEKESLIWAIQNYYLDDYNHKRSFNLRIAKKFVADEMDLYLKQASTGRHSFFEETIYSRGDEHGPSQFYFGFNHQ